MSPKDKNASRSIRPNFERIIEIVGDKIAGPSDLPMIIKRLFDEIWGSDKSEFENAKLLYKFGPWDRLKAATLDARLSPLPTCQIPDSEDGLLLFCEDLLDRTDSVSLSFLFQDGWPGSNNRKKRIEEFCSRLWRTSTAHPDFYRAVVSGNHGTAINYISQNKCAPHFLPKEATKIVWQMALIFAAHDVQATAARARLSQKRPFGWLHRRDEKGMTAAGAIVVWRVYFRLLDGLLNRYRTLEEEQKGKPERKLGRHDAIFRIRKRIENSKLISTLRTNRQQLDELVIYMRADLARKDNEFFNALRSSKNSYTGNPMSSAWYSGLSPLGMTAVSVIRLLHAENVVEQLHSGGIQSCDEPAELFLLNSCDSGNLPNGWKTRAASLMNELRHVIIQDGNYRSKSSQDERNEGGGADGASTYLGSALVFLDFTRSDSIDADVTQLDERRLTLSLLDIGMAVRLQR